jgi:hypothetical protein
MQAGVNIVVGLNKGLQAHFSRAAQERIVGPNVEFNIAFPRLMSPLAALYHIFFAALPRDLLLQTLTIFFLIQEFLDALAWLKGIGIGDTA